MYLLKNKLETFFLMPFVVSFFNISTGTTKIYVLKNQNKYFCLQKQKKTVNYVVLLFFYEC